MVFDLSSFAMIRTEKKWFQGNRIMRNMKELRNDMDSLRFEVDKQLVYLYESKETFFRFHNKIDSVPLRPDLVVAKNRRDSLIESKTNQTQRPMRRYKLVAPISARVKAISDSLITNHMVNRNDISFALSTARNAASSIQNINTHIYSYEQEYRIHQIQWHKILASAIACMAMFLIGAPLGAIIKKGGLGVPVLASILFFILYYVLSLLGEKWGKNGIMPVPIGMWIANVTLFVVGPVFLIQARRDARLFEADFYHVMWDKVMRFFSQTKPVVTTTLSPKQ
jgi:lipopolysaccharide export system permease protein